MSITLNEAALRFLLEDPAGPVGLDLQRRSESVTTLVRQNAQKIIKTLPPDLVDYEIQSSDDGLRSVIGIKGAGRWSEYLAAKEGREGVIFAPALDAGLDVS